MLEEHRARIEREVRAVGAVLVEAPDYHSHRTGFLVAKDLVLTVNHLFTSVLTPGDQSPALRPGTQVRFVTADRLDEAGANGTSATLIAIDREVRGGLALLRLENQVADVDPLPISPLEQEVRRDGRLYLIGYPFMQTNLDTELVRHVFGDNLGVKRLQPGYLVAAPADKPGFDHDAFTLEGSAGSPVIDLETGRVLGLHWGGMNQSNFRRGRATCLWKPQNRGILRAAGVVSDPQGAA
jgi:endonuclease G